MTASTIRLGDCVAVMAELEPASIDAIVTDPPYGLAFMGKEWDRYSAREFEAWCESWAAQALRVLKPGGHLLAFGGTRTYHRLAAGIEDAGFEVRDTLAWMYGSGFPKSLDVGKAIDKRPGVDRHAEFAAHLAERRAAAGLSRADVSEHVVGTRTGACWNWEHHQFPEARHWPALATLLHLDPAWEPIIAEAARDRIGTREGSDLAVAPGQGTARAARDLDITAPATPEAAAWQGWGTALKPAYEPIVLARKPLAGTVAANVLAHGTGALNIDACRIEHSSEADLNASMAKNPGRADTVTSGTYGAARPQQSVNTNGRWPANVLLDDEAGAMLDAQTGELPAGVAVRRNKGIVASSNVRYSGDDPTATRDVGYGDTGGASRFFYVAKASTAERNAGLEDLTPGKAPTQPRANVHPTVKPIELMRWLIRLATPPDGTVLDPFTGSGTTGIAAALERRPFIGIERDPEYHAIATARIEWWTRHAGEGDTATILNAAQARHAREQAGALNLFDTDPAA